MSSSDNSEGTFRDAAREFSRVTMKMTNVDEYTKELVRIKEARFLGCEFCMSVRSAPARRMGMNEDVLGQLARGDLDAFGEREKAALSLADAFLNYPAGLTKTQKSQIEENLNEDERLEILMKLVAHRASKPYIALGMNRPRNDGVLTPFEYGDGGELLFEDN